MWRWLPINKVVMRIVLFSLLNVLITSNLLAVRAQSNLAPNSVVSIKEDRNRSSVALQTSAARKIRRPIIQFLQGENGNTVMVADFHDVVFPFATKVINVNSVTTEKVGTMGSARVRGIELVRIGRYQDSPPIFRIAVVSSDAAKLRTVNFESRPGSLTVKWSKAAAKEQVEPAPLAPPISNVLSNTGVSGTKEAPEKMTKANNLARRRAYQSSYQFRPSQPVSTVPPFAPPITSLDPGTVAENARAGNPGHVNNSAPENWNPELAASYYPLRPPIQPPAIQREEFKLQDASGSVKQTSSANKSSLAMKNQAPAVGSATTFSTNRITNLQKSSDETNTFKDLAPSKAPRIIPSKAPYMIPHTGTAKIPLVAPDVVSNEHKHDQAESSSGDNEKPRGPGMIRSFLSKIKSRAESLISPLETGDGVQALNERTSSSAVSTSANNVEDKSPPAKSAVTPEQVNAEPPVIALTPTGNSGYALKVSSRDRNDLNFTSLRLHNPERFVIDFENLRSIQSASVPQPQNMEFLKAVRVGAPDPTKSTGRLVLDLSSENVSVIPGETDSENTVALVIGESSNPLAGINAPPGSTLVLDPGHGGSDPGAQRGYVREKDLTLQIAEKTYRLLTSRGVKVIMTRTSDTFVPLPDRVSMTNELKPDAFLSVHINSLESTSEIHGIETYYQTDMSRLLAESVHKELVSELSAPDRAVRKARFYVINRADVPAVLAEVGFISNKTERDKLVSSDYQEKIAGALAKGAILYLKQHSAVAKKISGDPSENGVKSGFKADTDRGSRRISSVSRLAQKGLGIKSNE